MNNLKYLSLFDKRQIFRFFVDGHFMKKYRGWLGYEEREPGSVQSMLNGFSYIIDHFDLSAGVTAKYLKELHKACTFGVLMPNIKTTPGDMRYLESYYLLHKGDVSIESLTELFEFRKGDQTYLFYDKGFDKPVEELDIMEVYSALQKQHLKFRPWYPNLTESQLDALNLKGTLAEFYVAKHYIQIQYATKIDEYISEFNNSIFKCENSQEKLLCISKFVRKLELLHAFPEGNGRTYVPALMNHLLLYFGFLPAILYNPNLDAEYSTVEWASEIQRGMQNTRALIKNPSLNLYGYSIDEASKDDTDNFLNLADSFIKKFTKLYSSYYSKQAVTKSKSKNNIRALTQNKGSNDYLYSLFLDNKTQRFFRALHKCNNSYVFIDTTGKYYCDNFDPMTGTFTQSLNLSGQLDDEEFEAFEILKYVKGNLSLTDLATSSIHGLRNVISISGDLIINNAKVTKIDAFNELAEVENIELYGLPHLDSISGFNSLLNIPGRIYINTNASLKTINGFDVLNSIGKSIEFVNNFSLTTINGFSSLKEIKKGSLLFKSNDNLRTITAFSSLETIGEELWINRCLRMTKLNQPASLKKLKNIFIKNTGISEINIFSNLFSHNPDFSGSIKIISNKLSDTSCLKGLKTIKSSLYLHDNELTNLTGLEELTKVDASFTLSLNKLTDISQLNKLKKINGVFTLSYNKLTNLHGLESLQSIKTKKWGDDFLCLKLYGNADEDGKYLLKDISALANVKDSNGELVIFIDENQTFDLEPAKDSTFYTQNKVEFQQIDET